MCVGHHYAQTTTNNVNKTWALLQTTAGNDEPNIVNVIYGIKITIVYAFAVSVASVRYREDQYWPSH